RFRAVPTFGSSTIRRFCNNVSAMKKLAGRDFEDMLQCIIPVFEGLLAREDDKIVLDLLFELVAWHAYAKLRLHTVSSLKSFEGATSTLGAALRKFKRTTCQRYETFELPSEEAARGRRNARQAAPGKQATKDKASSKRSLKQLNLSTAKLHTLGHYVRALILFGTTDNYTTQIVSVCAKYKDD
ncbi:hypothetical protein OBBRIDRAFT_872907, partial [Obba rivulosa]